MVAQAVWTNQNKLRVGGVKKSSYQVVYGAMDFLVEFQEGVYVVSELSPSIQTRWIPPLPNKYKINVNGAVFATQKSVGIGVLIRDSDGSIIGDCSNKLWVPLDAVEVEAKAIEFRLLLILLSPKQIQLN